MLCICESYLYFFLSGFSFTDTDDSQNSRGKEVTIFYSHEHSKIYLQLCMWDDYHIFLIATLVFTRLLLDEIYQFIELLFDWLIDWLMMWLLVDVILGFFYSLFDTGKAMGSNLHRHITLVLQANRLTKCTSHPKWDMEQMKYEAHHKNDKQQMK